MLPFARLVSTAPSAGSAGVAQDKLGQNESFAERALTFALWVTLVTSVFEGPLRYGLALVHLDPIIFLRDALLILALAGFIAVPQRDRKLPLSVGVFIGLVGIHSYVSYMNLHSLSAIFYGIKMLMPAFCAFLVPTSIFRPSKAMVRLVAVMWVTTVIGATVDKLWVDYPWVGMNVQLGGVDVYLGRDWQSGFLERIAGLTRSSINLAVIMPLLSCILLTRWNHRAVRAGICAVTLLMLYWTTQKGAILGFALAIFALGLARPPFAASLKAGVAFSVVLMLFAPTVLIFFELPRDRGTFSFESFLERINWMWPGAWEWIGRFSPVMGVGMGGIGGAQRFYAPLDRNAADNLFLYLFANFGVASLVYLGLVVWLACSVRVDSKRDDGVAYLSLIFLLLYGVVVTLLEDQVASLWLGATLGWLNLKLPKTRVGFGQLGAAPPRKVLFPPVSRTP